MPNFLKPILALIVSSLIYTGYHYLADEYLTNFIQTRFYNPSILNSYIKENNIDAGLVQNHIIELQDKFAAILNEPVVRRSFLYDQSAEDIYERSRLFGILLESTGGLQSVQFVDSNGIRLHYSTAARDLLNRTLDSTAYRNYNEDPQSLPFETVSVPAGSGAKYTMDEKSGRIIFSYPFHDSMDVYRGTALFNIAIGSLAERLIAESRINVSDVVSIIENPPGILLGTPETSKANIHERAAGIWSEGVQERVILDAEDSEVSFSLIYTRTGSGMFFGRLVNNIQFLITEHMGLLFKLAMFLTFYLTVFFFFNLKPNPVSLVRTRIKRLRENLFERLYINKSPQDRIKWILELEQRREEIRAELKHNLKLRGRAETRIDGIINKSWDELLTVIKSGSGQDLPASLFEKTAAQQADTSAGETADIEPIEEAESIDAAEEIDEIEEAEAIDAAEEIDEIEEAEAFGEAEELEEIDEVEAAGEAEEIGEIEEIDEVEEVEALGDADEVDEVETLSGAEDISEIEEVEALSDAEDIEVVEALSGIDDIEEIEEAEEFDETDELEEIEELAEIPARNHKGLLELASGMIPEPVSANMGLLARAEQENLENAESTAKVHRGLLALASEIEFNHPVNIEEETEDDDLPADIDVVSPFSSMFSTLVIEDDDSEQDDQESKEESI